MATEATVKEQKTEDKNLNNFILRPFRLNIGTILDIAICNV